MVPNAATSGTLAAVAAAVVVVVIYARQAQTGRLARVASDRPTVHGLGMESTPPGRWYHRVAAGLLLCLPFVQWFVHAQVGSTAAMFVPLAIVMGMFIGIGALRPRIPVTKDRAPNEQLLVFFVLAAAFAASLAIPVTNVILVIQIVLMDILGIGVANKVGLLLNARLSR